MQIRSSFRWTPRWRFTYFEDQNPYVLKQNSSNGDAKKNTQMLLLVSNAIGIQLFYFYCKFQIIAQFKVVFCLSISDKSSLNQTVIEFRLCPGTNLSIYVNASNLYPMAMHIFQFVIPIQVNLAPR